MSRRQRLLGAACALLGLLHASLAAAQPAAEAAMQEGVRLAQAGLHRTALLRFEEVVASGFETPLLHYNIGVSHYSIGNFDRAAAAFGRATADAALAPLARYNMGLAQRGAGQHAEAARTFAAVADDRGADQSLRTLAAHAGRAVASSPPPARRTSSRAERPKTGELRVSLATGYGQDDNLYRTPAGPYVDLSRPGPRTVTPEEPLAAPYLPIDFAVSYVFPHESGDTTFVIGYDLDGRYYESQFANADDISQRIYVAAELALPGRAGRRRTFVPTFFVKDHFHSNFDPDDGFDRVIGEENLENRFAYDGGGVDLRFEHLIGKWTWRASGQIERRNHAHVPVVASWNQQLLQLTAGVSYALGDLTRIDFDLRQYRRDFDERRARSLDGLLDDEHPLLGYDYSGASIGIERQIVRGFLLQAQYLRLRRTDIFEGYDDYEQSTGRIAAVVRPGRRIDLSVAALTRTYEYPYSFAFNVAAGGPRETEYTGAELRLEYRINDKLAVWGHVATEDVTSTDLRAEHQRSLSGFGVRWQL